MGEEIYLKKYRKCTFCNGTNQMTYNAGNADVLTVCGICEQGFVVIFVKEEATDDDL